jgi:UDP-3-O-[3-hydroxymyristoyl] N-acetylglucosamine deacetylase
MKQKTIAKPLKISGIGIHSGEKVDLFLCPAKENSGITFIRNDKKKAQIKVSVENLIHTNRATALKGEDNLIIRTPEHLLAALSALSITNIIIEMNSEEVPILDGSSLPFYTKIKNNGILPQKAHVHPLTIQTPLKFSSGNKIILALPQKYSSFTYFFDHESKILPPQMAHISNFDRFEKDIAPARTFGFEFEINNLKKLGLAKGGSLENALVIGDTHYLNPPRFTNECARHKCLDLIGDCWVIGRPILGSIIGIKSGHVDTMHFLKKLMSNYK